MNIIAWWRCRIWGFCPECNSDAPKLWDCKICNWDTNSPFNIKKRKKYWKKFKNNKNK